MTNEQLEAIRCFESVARIEWVRAQPCVVPACVRTPTENVHIQQRADRRLADSTFIVPMCAAHRQLLVAGLGTDKFEAIYDLDLALEAVDLEARWRLHGSAGAAGSAGSAVTDLSLGGVP